MPALSGQVVMTLRDETGQTVIETTVSYDPATGDLRDATKDTSDGTKTGALIVDNRTNRAIKCTVANEAGTVSRTVNIPRDGFDATVAQLAAQGLTRQSQFNGLTFDLV